ncbi:thioredoxin family protein [Spirulina subsalsa]|uniref:thioredoxin family protein n=1 Tax=Spirulina subsalsa TaxID=54311 RepID=UPI0002FBD9E2|nr:thioredoxin family protein [Spirulina subsalsa]
MTNPTTNPTEPNPKPYQRLRNLVLALVAVLLSATLVWGLQTETGVSSLETQAAQATPLEVALHNGKPTLMEFYANWCTSCQAMAKDLGEVKADYENQVNFVMLNVDNTKWLPEVLRYRVDGIPHFVYFNAQGEAIAQTIGEQPKPILQADLEALIAQQTLPYANQSGKVSAFQAKVKPQSGEDPRSHGGS